MRKTFVFIAIFICLPFIVCADDDLIKIPLPTAFYQYGEMGEKTGKVKWDKESKSYVQIPLSLSEAEKRENEKLRTLRTALKKWRQEKEKNSKMSMEESAQFYMDIGTIIKYYKEELSQIEIK